MEVNSFYTVLFTPPQRIEREKKEKNNETLRVLRHSCSHIMAQAVQKLFPQAKLAIGLATDDGFYYDFDLTDGYAFTQDDLEKIENEIKKSINALSGIFENGKTCKTQKAVTG